jgi:hypothetical protein
LFGFLITGVSAPRTQANLLPACLLEKPTKQNEKKYTHIKKH